MRAPQEGASCSGALAVRSRMPRSNALVTEKGMNASGMIGPWTPWFLASAMTPTISKTEALSLCTHERSRASVAAEPPRPVGRSHRFLAVRGRAVRRADRVDRADSRPARRPAGGDGVADHVFPCVDSLHDRRVAHHTWMAARAVQWVAAARNRALADVRRRRACAHIHRDAAPRSPAPPWSQARFASVVCLTRSEARPWDRYPTHDGTAARPRAAR